MKSFFFPIFLFLGESPLLGHNYIPQCLQHTYPSFSFTKRRPPFFLDSPLVKVNWKRKRERERRRGRREVLEIPQGIAHYTVYILHRTRAPPLLKIKQPLHTNSLFAQKNPIRSKWKTLLFTGWSPFCRGKSDAVTSVRVRAALIWLSILSPPPPSSLTRLAGFSDRSNLSLSLSLSSLSSLALRYWRYIRMARPKSWLFLSIFLH